MTKYFYGGEKGLPSIAKKFGLSLRTLEVRVQGMGMTIEEAVATPVYHRKSRDMKGVKRKPKVAIKSEKDRAKDIALSGKW